MKENHYHKIAAELGITAGQVAAVDELLTGGGTVPFIARYRKEQTGSLDEVQITIIRDRLSQLVELDKRREAIVKSLEERELMTDDLRAKIEAAETMSELEDIYLPFRPKRRTRAMIARERGLEPLAEAVFAQETGLNPYEEAEKYIDPEKGVNSAEEALAGAGDIIAEWVNEDQAARRDMRELFMRDGILISKVITGKEEDGAKYRDYFDWNEPASKAPSHRMLAVRRGEKEGFLSMRILPEEESVWKILDRLFIKNNSLSAEEVRAAIRDSYKRLLGPSMETETRMELKTRADKEAIRVFAENLRELLLSPPLGEKNVMGIDPGFRTGCKVVCLSSAGDLLHNETVFPHSGERARSEAGKRIIEMAHKFEVEVIAAGNGTAGRETVTFVKALDFGRNIPVIMVNESGASVYSASKAARDEFPDYDVTVRGAVSIGRRLMDPLAELVKIDPKSIGVGQYQHDVDQKELQSGLEDVVVSCVNAVGVDLNTASPHLLAYVSGLKPSIAENIVNYRSKKGRFQSRKELLEVPGFGPKTFELSAGFIRIRNGENPLDASAVHPESYRIVEA
ncbi:MAG: helix-hairpin-helix domain-containing protein, partial [FCB group bacterium]|nr:helix-hairpin-helix domain-containing protein [FCB group bacterium]